MKYKIVVEWDGGLTCYHRRWFRWRYIGDYRTIAAARAQCAWHCMCENMKKKSWTYEVFSL